MWKSIKKFFKWIADHTGISWILGKLGWQSNDQEQEEDFEFLDEKAPAKSKKALLKVVGGKIKLVTSAENYEALYKHFENKEWYSTVVDGKFCFNCKSESDKQFYITGCYDSKMIMRSGNIRLSINSIGTLDGKEVYGNNEPEKMKGLLDLSNNKMYISINPDAPKVIAKSNQFMDKQVQEKQNDITSQMEVRFSRLNQTYDLFHPEMKQSVSNLTSRIEKLNGNSGTFLCKKSRLIDGKKSQDNSTVINGVAISNRAKLVPFPEAHNFVLKEKLEMKGQLMKMQAERGFIDEEGDKWFDAKEPSSTAKAPATERHCITNPSVNGNGYY